MIRHHPRLLAKPLYVTAVVGLVGGTAGQLLSRSNWVEMGRAGNPLFISWLAVLSVVLITLGKGLLKRTLSEDDQSIQLGLYQDTAAPEWTLDGTRILVLVSGAVVFLTVTLFSSGLFSSIRGRSTHAILLAEVTSACEIGKEIVTGGVTDKEAMLKRIADARDNVLKTETSMQISLGQMTLDAELALGTEGILEISREALYSDDDAIKNQLRTMIGGCPLLPQQQ
jgi:hypothetical protein